MEAPMTAADIAAVTRNNDGMDGFGSGWWGIILIALLFGWGRGGFGGNGYGNGEPVTESALCNANSFNELKSQIGRMNDQQAAIARQTDNAICNLGYEQAQLANGIQSQIADCCCTTKQLIAETNYNNAMNTCSIKEAVHAEGEQTRAMIQANKIESLQNKVTQLENQAALAAATCGMVRMPQQFTYAVPFGGFGCGCNTGCGVSF